MQWRLHGLSNEGKEGHKEVVRAMRRCSKGNTGVENDHMEDVRDLCRQ